MEIQNPILRIPAVLNARGKSRSGHYADILVGEYPRPIKLSSRAIGWLRSEVEAVNAATASGARPDELRSLARALESQRVTGHVSVATTARGAR